MINSLIAISENNKAITLVGYDIGASFLCRLLNKIKEDHTTENIQNLKQKITYVEFHDPLLFPETARSLTVPASLTIGGLLYGMPLLASIPTIWGIPAAPIMSAFVYFLIGDTCSNWLAKKYYKRKAESSLLDPESVTLPQFFCQEDSGARIEDAPNIQYSIHNVSTAKQVLTNPSTEKLYETITIHSIVALYSDQTTRMTYNEKSKLNDYIKPSGIPFLTKLWWKICSPSTAINACVCLMVVSALMHRDLLIEILQKYVTINR